MFTEELKLIKEAEEQADEMRRNAKLSAKTFIEESDAKANKMIEEAFAVEKEKCDALLNEGKEIAQKFYDEAIKEAEALCEKFTEQACLRQDKAVQFIAERIVDSSVNC